MNVYKVHGFARKFCAVLIFFFGAITASAKSNLLPKGWEFIEPCNALQNSCTLIKADFDGDGMADRALLVSNDAVHKMGVVVFFGKEIEPILASTWQKAEPNKVTLSQIDPGTYREHCSGNNCREVVLHNNAIGVCFQEASCKIVYFRAGKFEEIFVTD